MTKPPVRGPAGLAWRCDACGRSSMWTDGHATYGSLRELDEERWDRIVVTCSPACRLLARERGLVPVGARMLSG